MSIKTALILQPEPSERWDLARQMGVDNAVARFPRERVDEETKPWDFEPLLQMKERYNAAGFEVPVIEDRPPMDDIRRGGPAMDDQIDEVCRMLEHMGAVGIPVWCSAWMYRLGWTRTSLDVPDRGGSKVTAYDHSLMRDAPPVGNVTEEELWENLEYFLERTVPVAEEAGVKMAMHPDDPPLSPLRGVGRIMTSVENYDRLLDLYPSEHNGITFCQGNFAAMGADIPEAIRHFDDHIHFVHFRDVDGNPERFRETWHDAGPTDMLEAMRTYDEIGFDGAMRPDHVPTMAGEENADPGYEMKGRLFAVGYMRGLQEQVDAE